MMEGQPNPGLDNRVLEPYAERLPEQSSFRGADEETSPSDDMDGLRRLSHEMWAEFRASRNPYVRFVRFPLKLVKYAGIALVLVMLAFSRYILILLLLLLGGSFVTFIAYKVWT